MAYSSYLTEEILPEKYVMKRRLNRILERRRKKAAYNLDGDKTTTIPPELSEWMQSYTNAFPVYSGQDKVVYNPTRLVSPIKINDDSGRYVAQTLEKDWDADTFYGGTKNNVTVSAQRPDFMKGWSRQQIENYSNGQAYASDLMDRVANSGLGKLATKVGMGATMTPLLNILGLGPNAMKFATTIGGLNTLFSSCTNPKEQNDNTKKSNNIHNTGYNAQDLLEMFEGYSDKVYFDSKGIPTAGIGHVMTQEQLKRYPVKSVVPKDSLQKWFNNDIKGAINTVNNEMSDKLPIDIIKKDFPDIYQTLITMAYQNRNFVRNSGSPLFNEALVNYIENPSKENMSKVIWEMNRKDEYDKNSPGLAKRYGVTRFIFNQPYEDTIRNINKNNIKEYYNQGKFNHYGAR